MESSGKIWKVVEDMEVGKIWKLRSNRNFRKCMVSYGKNMVSCKTIGKIVVRYRNFWKDMISGGKIRTVGIRILSYGNI